ncbi:MAG: glycosyltransferase family 2 protein [Anaerolineae bacterium]|nr:MAG: glycosyltransferase family 2 protein [Anaerolineae bacterium]
MNEPFVVIVILNTNRRRDTLECLASIHQNTYNNHKSIVLDNNSTDGSVEAIQERFPSAQIIRLVENLGYAGNNNIGIEAAIAQGAEWVFVLNEDTILDPECLTQLVRVGLSDDQIGIVGPMVYHHNEPEIIQSAGGLLGSNWESIHLAKDELDRGQFTNSHQVEWISGCGIMVRGTVIEQVGMIDARFFYFWEETEWCVRAAKSGWLIFHVPKAKLWHKGVQRDYHPKPSLFYYSTRNWFLLLSKHHAPFTAWIVAWITTLRTLTSWSIRPKWRSMRANRDAMFKGMLDFIRGHYGQMPL